MLRNSGKPFFALIFLAVIYAAVCTRPLTFAQTLRSTLPVPSLRYLDFADDAIGFNPATNRIYLFGYISGEPQFGYSPFNGQPNKALTVLDATNYNQLAVIPIDCFAQDSGAIAINPQTNRIYVTEGYGADTWLGVFDGNTNTVITDNIQLPFGGPGLRGPVIDTTNNRIYVMSLNGSVAVVDGNTNMVVATFDTNFFCGGGWWWGYTLAANGMAINSNTHRIYVPADMGQSILVIDGTNNTFSVVPLDFQSSGEIVVNPTTNRVYISGVDIYSIGGGGAIIGVLDGVTNTLTTHISLPEKFDVLNWGFPLATVINTTTNRIYKYGFECGNEGCLALSLATIDGNTDTLLSHNPVGSIPIPVIGDIPNAFNAYLAINPNNNLLYSTGPNDASPGTALMVIIDPGSTQITTTGNASVTADHATLNFSNVTSPGSVSVTPISDPATAGDVPGGFAISETAAYEITKDTSLQFSGPVTTCFSVPNITDAATFSTLRVLHRELNATTGQYELVDRTSSSDFASNTVCATTTSFSPFYIARAGNKIKSLFDRSKAYKAGSTIPVKLQLLDASDNNISSAATALTPRGLRLVGGNTAASVTDSGNANADGNFRYDSTLGGTGGYIFNLSTKGLVAGQYVLSFYAGNDRSFFYMAKFEVK